MENTSRMHDSTGTLHKEGKTRSGSRSERRTRTAPRARAHHQARQATHRAGDSTGKDRQGTHKPGTGQRPGRQARRVKSACSPGPWTPQGSGTRTAKDRHQRRRYPVHANTGPRAQGAGPVARSRTVQNATGTQTPESTGCQRARTKVIVAKPRARVSTVTAMPGTRAPDQRRQAHDQIQDRPARTPPLDSTGPAQ